MAAPASGTEVRPAPVAALPSSPCACKNGASLGSSGTGSEQDVVDLSVELGRLSLSNPVLVASGTFGYVREMAPFVRLERLGGVIPKTVTFRPRAGNPTPRTVETASGLLNAIGLDNDGIAHFIEHHLPYLRTTGTAVIANIAGEDEDQFVAMAGMLGVEPGAGGDRAEHLVPERQPRAGPGDRRRGGRPAGASGPARRARCRSSPS